MSCHQSKVTIVFIHSLLCGYYYYDYFQILFELKHDHGPAGAGVEGLSVTTRKIQTCTS